MRRHPPKNRFTSNPHSCASSAVDSRRVNGLAPVTAVDYRRRKLMRNLLVLNHGTSTDTTSKDCQGYLISRITKKMMSPPLPQAHAKDELHLSVWHSKARLALTYPGFDSTEWKTLWKRRESRAYLPLSSAIQAKGYIRQTASWLLKDIELLGTKVNELDTVTFIGHSRGCVLMWFQIYTLASNGFGGKLRLLQFDPCYGPRSRDEVAEIVVSRELAATDTSQVLMLDEGGGLLRAYPIPLDLAPDEEKTYFLPGLHGSACDMKDLKYPGVAVLGEDIAARFLGEIPPNDTFGLSLRMLTDAERCKYYALCKLFHNKVNYGFCVRDDLADSYRRQKTKGAKSWARLEMSSRRKVGFFYSPQEYKAFAACWPALAGFLIGSGYGKIKAHQEFQQADKYDPAITESIRRWSKSAGISLTGIA